MLLFTVDSNGDFFPNVLIELKKRSFLNLLNRKMLSRCWCFNLSILWYKDSILYVEGSEFVIIIVRTR